MTPWTTCFTSDGLQIITGGSDKSINIFDTHTGALVSEYGVAHQDNVSRVFALPAGEFGSLVASGDEGGELKLWDLRAGKHVMVNTKHNDYISGFCHHARERCLLAVSGDGTLSVHDLRQRKMRARSEEDADDELLSVVVAKGGKKVVVGSQSGVLNLYSWGYWKDCSDRFPGHPESVQSLVAYDDDTLISGSSDGAIRILSVLPNKLLGLVGEHADMPIEHLSLSFDRRTLASASHDQTVKLWDISYLGDHGGGEEEGEEAEGHGGSADEDESCGAGKRAAGLSRGRSGAVESEGSGSDEGSEEGSEAGGESEEGGGEEGSGSGSEGWEEEGEAGAGGSGDGEDEPEGEDESVVEQPKANAKPAAAAAPAVNGSGGSGGSAGAQQKGAGKERKAGSKASGAAAATSVPEPAAAKESDEEDEEGSDSDDGKKKGKRKREKTKWTLSKERSKQNKGGFFDGLL
ncbi:MAG: hypothetical protein WDW36_001403 [Sanguina aurantia]